MSGLDDLNEVSVNRSAEKYKHWRVQFMRELSFMQYFNETAGLSRLAGHVQLVVVPVPHGHRFYGELFSGTRNGVLLAFYPYNMYHNNFY